MSIKCQILSRKNVSNYVKKSRWILQTIPSRERERERERERKLDETLNENNEDERTQEKRKDKSPRSEGDNKKNRNWQSFYNWLEENIVDREKGGSGRGNIKEGKRGEYPKLVNFRPKSLTLLMIMLEKTLNIPLKNVVTFDIEYTAKIPKFEEYQEGKSITELSKEWFNCPEIEREYEKLFEEWKKDTNILP